MSGEKTAAAREPFKQWGILELMGHRKAAGLVQEVELFGVKMLRIDIPPGDRDPQPLSQIYGGSAIYCLTIVDEETAKAFAQHSRDKPLEVWSARQMLEAIEDKSQADLEVAEDWDGALT